MVTEKRTILLIDDVEENRIILAHRLEKEGFAIVTAENGKDGLEKLGNESIDLIFLDINMPVMDGHTFLKTIKSDPHFSSIPIIMISAMDEKQEVLKSMRAGACGYLAKPFSMEQVRVQVNLCLRAETTAK